MDFAVGIQENLIAILCYNEASAKRVRHLIPAKLYSKFYRELFEAGAAFLDKYDRPVGEHFLDEVERIMLLRPKDKDIYLDLFGSIDKLSDTANVEYVLDKASEFAEFQTLKAGIAKSLETLQPGTTLAVMETRNVLKGALEQSFEEFDAGLRLSDTAAFMSHLEQDTLETFPIGIPELDAARLGPTRQRLHVLGAYYGQGKSWWLLNMAKHAFLARKRILYLSLEMPIKEICQRIAQTFFGYGKQDDEHEFFRINSDENGRVLDLEQCLLRAPNVLNEDDLRGLRTTAEIFQRRAQFIVKCWPSGEMSMDMLRAFLDNLLASEGFTPDLIILDYLRITKIIDVKNLRLELGQAAVEFRGIGSERNAATATVAQNNRSSVEAETTTGADVAEDFSITAHADFYFTYNQTKAEKRIGAARIWVDKGRSEKGGFHVLLTQDYGRGQFTVSSARMADTYWDTVSSIVGEQVGD